MLGLMSAVEAGDYAGQTLLEASRATDLDRGERLSGLGAAVADFR